MAECPAAYLSQNKGGWKTKTRLFGAFLAGRDSNIIFSMKARGENKKRACSDALFSGEGGIRTLGGPKPTTVFETVPFNHSGTSPRVM
jgi:hypothetical protein